MKSILYAFIWYTFRLHFVITASDTKFWLFTRMTQRMLVSSERMCNHNRNIKWLLYEFNCQISRKVHSFHCINKIMQWYIKIYTVIIYCFIDTSYIYIRRYLYKVKNYVYMYICIKIQYCYQNINIMTLFVG